MSGTESNHVRDVDNLIRRQLDGRLSDAEFHDFEARLVDDAKFRERYIVLSDMEAILLDEPYEPSLSRIPFNHATNASPRSSFGQLVIATAVAVVCTVVFIVGNLNLESTSPPGGEVTGEDADSPRLMPTGIKVPDAAVVTFVEVARTGIKVGDRLKPGLISVPRGRLQLEFICGAQVLVAGPAELFIESESAATLYKGRAAARVPQRGRGFVLNSPAAAVYDLGTEFNVDVAENGDSEVAVLSGEVELSLLGDDGCTRSSRRVREDQSFQAVYGGALIETEQSDWMDKFQVISPSVAALNVPAEYVAKVLECGASDFWRFSSSSTDVVENEVEGSTDLRVMQPEHGITIADGSLFLERTDAARCLLTDQPLEKLNDGPFSFECWLNPVDLRHATCAGIFPASEPDALNHLGVVEVITDFHFKHDPGAMRFLYRSPPHRHLDHGQNIFSRGIIAPGLWHHVVCVRSSGSMQMYLNGQLVRDVELNAPVDEQDYHIVLGQLRPGPYPNSDLLERQFGGAIDEVAVYRRALSAEEVADHYRIIEETNESVSRL